MLACLGMVQPQIIRISPGGKAAAPPEPMGLQSPVRVATDGGDVVYVGDSDLNKVVVLKVPHMIPIREIGIGGAVAGIAASAGRVYVGNQTLGRIEVYDTLGNFEFVLGGLGVHIPDPTELEVDPEQELLFAVDASAKTVWVFSLVGTGSLIRAISGPGLTCEEFQHPTGLTLDRLTHEVFVADFGSIDDSVGPRVSIFGYDGTFHDVVWGSGGAQGYHFSKPQGIVLGESGHVFVVDAWLGKVVVMDRVTCQPVATIGQFGTNPGELRLPLDLVIHGDAKDLYVVSNQTRSIQAYPAGGTR